MLSSKIFDCASATHLLKWITICLFVSSCSASINDVFTVKKGTDKGGCDNYSDVLTNWFSEVQVLLEAGLQAFVDAENNDPVALATLDGYFGLKRRSSKGDRAAVQGANFLFLEYLERTSKFYSGNYKVIQDDQTETPWLFCNSDWEQPVQRTDFAFRVVAASEAAGSEIIEEFKSEDGTSQKLILTGVAIQDMDEYENALFNKGDRSSPNDDIPYWSQDLREYTFGPVYGDDPSTSTYCGTDTSDAEDKNLAGTDDATIPATVTLCPLSFNTPNFRRTLNFITPNTDEDAPDSVENFLPRSATLLHETIHLVQSTELTPDASYDLSEVKAAIMKPNKKPKTLSFSDPDNILGTTPLNKAVPGRRKLTNIELVRMNPETFVWFCVSYWYYLQDPIPNNVVATNFRYTFPAGNAVKVDVVV
ncbi:hypothetical protein sscle_14g102120 [Sclerotinia sclerotiorum 1980 UF-70]|uniref:Lysine-specific metallo-endopeptidase domain-containing protein n=1 Tax=Sclerotinia sclerotiorum (strain ATCC 18683 / 1980 / Ss-1) TaxID=665079 RepID=A0A1D9QKV1_SCLS1|nr:hypothetical protein sscle_14g102120 [Sclerotinia sclerotiorum 1980 UF-70]